MKRVIQGREVLLDERDTVLFDSKKWFLRPKGKGELLYLVGNFLTTERKWMTEYFHVLVMGKVIEGFHIDHKNGNPLDNRRENLRYVPYFVNALNTKVEGVDYRPSRKKWRSRIKHEGVQRFLGHFDTREEAVEARNRYFKKHLHGVKL